MGGWVGVHGGRSRGGRPDLFDGKQHAKDELPLLVLIFHVREAVERAVPFLVVEAGPLVVLVGVSVCVGGCFMCVGVCACVSCVCVCVNGHA